MSDSAPGLPELAADLLRGRAVLVTGGSLGIGRACAEQVLACGGAVCIAARSADTLARATEALGGSAPDRVHGVQADVSNPADADRMVAAAVERFGRLDALIHAAGVLGPIGATIDTDGDAWFDAIRVNLFGTFLVARAAARVLPDGGRIVLLSGGGATSPMPNYSAYAASKAAVVRFGETLAVELEPRGIAVNCLAPGFVATRLHDQTLAAGERAGADYLRKTREQLERGGVPVAVSARTAVFLVSDLARGITGKLVSAPWDGWWQWPEHVAELSGSDLFTLRRIVPRHSGMDWQ